MLEQYRFLMLHEKQSILTEKELLLHNSIQKELIILHIFCNFSESFASNFQGCINIRRLMSKGHEITFIRTWRVINTPFQIIMEEGLEMIIVASASIIKIEYWFIREEYSKTWSLHVGPAQVHHVQQTEFTIPFA